MTTLGEVKEQVLKYVPVMARPMVMYRDKHPIVWTGVYADIEVRGFCIHKLYKKCGNPLKIIREYWRFQITQSHSISK